MEICELTNRKFMKTFFNYRSNLEIINCAYPAPRISSKRTIDDFKEYLKAVLFVLAVIIYFRVTSETIFSSLWYYQTQFSIVGLCEILF